VSARRSAAAAQPLSAAPSTAPAQVIGADFADETKQQRKKRVKAAADAALAEEDARAAAARARGGFTTAHAPATATHWASSGPTARSGGWWDNLMAIDAAYEPRGFSSLATPARFGSVQATAGGGGGEGNHLATVLQGPGSDEPDEIYARLIDMGYDDDDASTYAYQCSSVEAAIQAIATKTDPAFLLAMRAYEEQAAAAASASLALTPSAASDAELARRLQAQVLLERKAGAIGGGSGGGGQDEWCEVRKKESKHTALAATAKALDADTARVLYRLMSTGKIKTSDVSRSALTCLIEAPPAVALAVVERLDLVLNGGEGRRINNLSRWLAMGVTAVLELTGDDDDDEEEEDEEEDDVRSLRSHASRSSRSSAKYSVLPPLVRLFDPRVRAAYLALLRRLGQVHGDSPLDPGALDFISKVNGDEHCARMVTVMDSIDTRPANLSSMILGRFSKFRPEMYVRKNGVVAPMNQQVQADLPPRPPAPPASTYLHPPPAVMQPAEYTTDSFYSSIGGYAYSDAFSQPPPLVAAPPPATPPPAVPAVADFRPWLAPMPAPAPFYAADGGISSFLPPPVTPLRGGRAPPPQEPPAVPPPMPPCEDDEDDDDDLRYMLSAMNVRS
jgi:hypothetical protein